MLDRVFSHDVTAAILESQNNETANMPVPWELNSFLIQKAFFCSNNICIDAGYVSKNTL